MAFPAHFPALTAVYCLLVAVFIAGGSNARDLRPSEHGLDYQNPGATDKSSPEMQSFFKGNSWSSSEVALPKAMNTSVPPQWRTRSHGERTGGSGGDHIRDALLVASLVCGITGVSLLIASALIYIFKFKKQRSSSSLSETAEIINK